MFRRYYINKEWIVSAAARRIYRGCAWVTLSFEVLLIWLMNVEAIPPMLASTVKLAILVGVLATAVTMVAMEYFLFGFDTSPAWKKTFWFLVMCVPPIGPALYCLIVYSKIVPTEKNSDVSLAAGQG